MNEENFLALNDAILTDGDEMKGKHLLFWTDKQLFGVPISDVVQIVQIQPMTELPEFPPYAKGIINLRGSVIPVIDIRLRFGKEEAAYDDHTCIIIISIGDVLFGLIVDSVEEVIDIKNEEISPPPTMTHECTNTYLTGIGKCENRIILLIDAQRILSNEHVNLINQKI